MITIKNSAGTFKVVGVFAELTPRKNCQPIKVIAADIVFRRRWIDQLQLFNLFVDGLLCFIIERQGFKALLKFFNLRNFSFFF